MKFIEIFIFIFSFFYFKGDSLLQLYDTSAGGGTHGKSQPNCSTIYVSNEFTRNNAKLFGACIFPKLFNNNENMTAVKKKTYQPS